jgi:pimeloyl-ACP methyl ester carboxylesterase
MVKKACYFVLTKSIGMYLNVLSIVNLEKAIHKAHIFFSNPRKGKFNLDTLPKTLRDAKLESIQHLEDRIQTYIWEGNETVILLIHGWESNSSRWKKMLPYLKKSGSTIVAIDGPAQGLSSGTELTVPKYAEFINIVCKKYQPKFIIGHSMGGKTCLYYQYKYQNPHIEKIVTLGAPAEVVIIFDNFIQLLSLNSKISKALVNKYENLFNIRLPQFNAQIFTKEISAKGLIVHDKEDKVVLFKEAEKIAQSWKKAEFIATKGLGHKLHDDELYSKIYAFLFEKDYKD